MHAHLSPPVTHARTLAVGALLLLAACADPGRSIAPELRPDRPDRLFVPTTTAYTAVTAGLLQTCALTPAGVINCWGANDYGEAPPTRTAAVGSFRAIGTGLFHTCGVRTDGQIECFGANNFGQAPALRTASGGSGYVAVDGGRYAGCALRNDGAVECWGDGGGAGNVPLVVASVGFYSQLSVGDAQGCALRNDGVINCWGALFTNANEAPAEWRASAGIFTQVSAGGLATCALRDDGVVECVGNNGYGNAPASRAATSGSFTKLSVGGDHTCALRTDGKVECWGRNDVGQALPLVSASNGGTFTSVSAGDFHTCALRNDGTLQCWGDRDRSAGTTVFPTATFSAPASVVVGAPIALALTNAQVPGYPAATSFTYAFDCGTGSGYAAPSSANTASCPTTATGTRRVRGKVIDQDGDAVEYEAFVAINSVSQSTTDLKTSISLASLSPDLRNALTVKLNAALDAIAKGKTATACSALADFINQVKAQRGKAIATATADAWIQQATALRASLGC